MLELAILIIRIVVGITMVAHGWHKVEKRTVLDAKWKNEYGFPVGSVILTAIAQIAGGLAILLGFLTSLAAVILALNMIVATYVSIWKHHEGFLSLPDTKGWDLNFLLVGNLIALIFLGDGSWSFAELLRGFNIF